MYSKKLTFYLYSFLLEWQCNAFFPVLVLNYARDMKNAHIKGKLTEVVIEYDKWSADDASHEVNKSQAGKEGISHCRDGF